MTDVVLHPDVADYLDGHQNEDRIKDKLREAADNPAHYLKRLSNRDEYRLRIGDYRALIDWDKQNDQLRVLEVGKRDGFYDE
jgi:mRNA interferase RelE/StbE